jgi:nitrate reductase gamma subunit
MVSSTDFVLARLLRLGSPLFQLGMLGLVAGHLVALLIPKSWTDVVVISEHAYYFVALGGGLVTGAMTVAGLVILIYRRRSVEPVFSTTTRMDKLIYAMFVAVILISMWNTLISRAFGAAGSEYQYRDGVSVWFRG